MPHGCNADPRNGLTNFVEYTPRHDTRSRQSEINVGDMLALCKLDGLTRLKGAKLPVFQDDESIPCDRQRYATCRKSG